MPQNNTNRWSDCVERNSTVLYRVWEESTLVAQSCPTLWDHMDCSPPGSSVHGIFQARILERVAISFSKGSSQPRNRTQVSCTAGRFFTLWATREVMTVKKKKKKTKSKKEQLLTLGENNFVQKKEYFVSNIYIEIIHVNTECSPIQILWENYTEKNEKKKKGMKERDGYGWVRM